MRSLQSAGAALAARQLSATWQAWGAAACCAASGSLASAVPAAPPCGVSPYSAAAAAKEQPSSSRLNSGSSGGGGGKAGSSSGSSGSGGGSGKSAAAKALAQAGPSGPLAPRQWSVVEDPSKLLDSVVIEVVSSDLGPAHAGCYYKFDTARVPEALRPFHQAFYPPRPAHLQRRGGCRGLQAEFAATGATHLMWRGATQRLADASDAAGARLLVRGPAGAGKSVALAALVERARARGEVAVYVPDARALVSGGFFYRRGDTGTYDTVIAAQHVLKSAGDAHADALRALPLRGAAPAGAAKSAGGGGKAAGGSLYDLVEAGISTDDDARLAVDCCLQLISELAAAASAPGGPRVLLAVDGYDSLYGVTGYGATEARRRGGRGGPENSGATYLVRRTLDVEELNLARGFRLLARSDLGAARVVAATSRTGGAPAALEVPTAEGVASFDMPRFSPVEVAHLLHFYHERGLAEAPSASQVEKLRAITNGSGADLRRLGPRTAQLDTNTL